MEIGIGFNEADREHRLSDLPGVGNSSFTEVIPILVHFKPADIKLLEFEAEPDGSISNGETLLRLAASMSSHLTCKNDKEHMAVINYIIVL